MGLERICLGSNPDREATHLAAVPHVSAVSSESCRSQAERKVWSQQLCLKRKLWIRTTASFWCCLVLKWSPIHQLCSAPTAAHSQTPPQDICGWPVGRRLWGGVVPVTGFKVKLYSTYCKIFCLTVISSFNFENTPLRSQEALCYIVR